MLCHVAAELKSDAASQPKANGTAPATAKPLLLLDDEPADHPTDTSEADNSRCHVCHLNFGLEELAVTHAREGIGCAKCHGECDAHIDDESWSSGGPGTPPEIMYPPTRIDSACNKCHDTHDAPAAQVIQRLLDRCSDKAQSTRIVCTDCHGNHRVNPNLRKAWWDKKTGKPLAPSTSARRAAPM
jgi:hypothetical protein